MIGLILRFIVSALVLLVVSWLIPGFVVAGFWAALWAALAIAAVSWLAQRLLGPGMSPQGRGLTSFLVAALVLWLVQFIIPGIGVHWVAALIASFVIGLVDAVVPTELR